MVAEFLQCAIAGLVVCLTIVAPSQAQYRFQVPDGFAVDRVAGPPEIQFPMFACFDDRGRLYVAESSGLDLYAELTKLTRKCRISVLEDRDGDGRYDRSHVYADKLTFPMGLVWREGRLYVADGHELIALEDRDGDDVAEKRSVLLGGFGHTDNGALHGQLFGPDGLLYSTLGSPDGYKITRADGKVIQGHTGILLRNRADGSHPDVLARGFTNLIEVDFWPTGEILGTNTWIQLPANGLRDSLVHLVEGGLYGYWEDLEGDTPPLVTGPKLPAITILPATACSGRTFNRPAHFPAPRRGNMLVAQFNTRNVTRHVFSRPGSTFRSENSDFLTTDDPDFHPADVLEDADGSLLVLDTGAWYVQHCPTGSIRASPAKGAIYRIRYTRSAAPADPWGLKIDWPSASAAELVRLFNDSRFAVRERAAIALGRYGEKAVAPLATMLRSNAGPPAKQHAVWALAAIPYPSAVAPLAEVLSGKDADLAALAARAISRRDEKGVAPQLHRLLQHEAAHVRMAAAEALAHCGGSESVPPLIEALTHDSDRFLQHAIIYALHRLADRRALETALDHPHPQVQRAGMILLDQPPHSCLAPGATVARATAADGDLRSAARTILQKHPAWGSYAVELVNRWIAKPELTPEEEAGLRDFVLAFQGNAAVRAAVAAAMSPPDDRLPERRRILLLQTMAQSSLAEVPDAWKTTVAQAVKHPAAEVREQAVRTLGTLQIPGMEDELAALAADSKQPETLRVEALRAVIRRRPELTPAAFDLLLGRMKPDRGPLDRLAAGEVMGQAVLDAPRIGRLIETVRDDPVIAPAIVLGVLKRSKAADAIPKVVDYVVQCLKKGWEIPDQQLQKVLAGLPAQERLAAEQRIKTSRPSTDVKDQAARIAEYEPLLKGGDAARGRTLYFGKSTCSTCHTVGKEGGTIGPDLTTVGAIRSGRDLIESLLFPSATIAQKYETYVVVNDDGKIVQGILARQSKETIVLYDASGAELRLRKDGIEQMEVSRRSLMPEGVANVLARDEIRDLLAYLQTLR